VVLVERIYGCHEHNKLTGKSLSKLLLLACSQRKRVDVEVMRAIDRYDGPSFRLLRRFLRQTLISSVDIEILSAKYGLISTDYPLPYYDCRMTQKQSNILNSQVIADLKDSLHSKAYTNFLIWLGRDYLETISGYEAIIPRGLTVQIATGGIGRKLSILHDWLYDDVPSFQQDKVRVSPKTIVRTELASLRER
jgi:hypothetical protein